MPNEVQDVISTEGSETQTDPVSREHLDISQTAMSALSSLLDSKLVLAEQPNASPILHAEDIEGSLQADSPSSLTESQAISLAVHESLAVTLCTPEATLPSFLPNRESLRQGAESSQGDDERSDDDDDHGSHGSHGVEREEEVVEYINFSPPEDLGNPISITEIRIDDDGKVTITEIFKFENVS